VAELVTLGIKSGGFYFLVWAPGAALVREFWRAGHPKRSTPSQPDSPQA
jgi:hypothetical protein